MMKTRRGIVQAEIITIGNELISGHIIDTNAAFLSEAVFSAGAQVTRIVTVGDEVEAIAEALREAMTRADLILATGGLGPTPDDLTVEATARALGRRLTLHKAYLQTLMAKFSRWKLKFTPSDERVAYLPQGAEPLPNPIGLCGFRLDEGAKTIFFFPGVHREVKELVESSLLPFVREKIHEKNEVIKASLLKVFGPTEAQVKEMIQGLLERGIDIAYLPSFPEVHLRLIAQGSDEGEVAARLQQTEDTLAKRLGNYLFGRGEDSMEEVVGRLLAARGATMAVAESCTGGLIAHRITEIPGSSAYFLRGVVAYSSQAKEALLGVPPALLKRYSPVSREVAEQMAAGVRASSGATIGIATTGIAGPTGGTTENPVGRVFIALAAETMLEAKQYDFFGDRHAIKLVASEVALDRVRRYLLDS
jgi:nicotinamide-nucleotide amidase